MKVSNKMKRVIKRIVKKAPARDYLESRKKLADLIKEATVDDKVTVNIHECGHVRGFTVGAIPMKVLALIQKEQEFSDGPLTVEFSAPL